jgi:hypothetical protein
LARSLFPEGSRIETDRDHEEEGARLTHSAIRDPNVPAVFGGIFSSRNLRIRTDILARGEDRSWTLWIVKSGTTIKERNVYDLAYQCHVLESCGIPISRAGILNLNKRYVYDGSTLDLEALFNHTDLGGQVREQERAVAEKVADMEAVMCQAFPPVVEPSRQCHHPYQCGFYDLCIKDMTDYWVAYLPEMPKERLEKLADLGIKDVRDVPNAFGLSSLQARIKSCLVKGRDYVGPGLESGLSSHAYPIHFVDFEAVDPVVPRYAYTRPFQMLPFQWSDHILFEDGRLIQKQYLCEQDKDPREEFAATFLDTVGVRGSICMYSEYEKREIRALSDYLPLYRKKLLSLLDRMWDLCSVIRQHYYHPRFRGSFSIKKVLPALVPHMSYDDLSIQMGRDAGAAYLTMIDKTTPLPEKQRIRDALLAYCRRDTLAMVKIREELLRICAR